MSDSLLTEAAAFQRRAHEIVAELELIGRCSRIGRPVLVGAMRFGLMTKPNIDLEVYVPEPRVREGFETVQKFAEHPCVRHIEYRNFLGTDDPGLYWRIDFEDEGTLWDIDFWLVPEDHPYAGLADRFASAMEHVLSEETRNVILALKKDREPGIRGIDVYRAVFAGNVRTREKFSAWLADHPVSNAIVDWIPE